MAYAQIHPNWDKEPAGITDGYSLEMTAKDIESLREAAPLIPADTPVAVTFLPGEEAGARIAATVAVRDLGFEPMPHFSARRITDAAEVEASLKAVVEQAGVRRCFIVAGDPAEPQGPFFDSSALIATGAFERAGITAIGVGGHPDGHPNMTEAECWAVLDKKVPLFGICLGHQILALTLGGKTRKMARGHRGANQPVKDLTTGKVEITSQNHGFCVIPESLPENTEVTHVSLFDGINEGLRCTDKPAFSVQYHPEASPGPTDSHYLFDRFVEMIDKSKGK